MKQEAVRYPRSYDKHIDKMAKVEEIEDILLCENHKGKFSDEQLRS